MWQLEVERAEMWGGGGSREVGGGREVGRGSEVCGREVALGVVMR